MDKLVFKNFITKKIPLADTEWQLIDDLFQPRQLKPDELLLQEGAVCQHLYFLETGLLRFFVWKEGVDKTKYFTFDHYLFTSQYSFSTRTPSSENIQAVEACELLQVSFSNQQMLYDRVPQW